MVHRLAHDVTVRGVTVQGVTVQGVSVGTGCDSCHRMDMTVNTLM